MSAIHIEGLTLRDWLAGQALAGLSGTWTALSPRIEDSIACAAYRIADAMLRERQRRLDAAQPAVAPADPDDIDQMFSDLGEGGA